jgi:predicted DNA-binding protein with PD1-like motif
MRTRLLHGQGGQKTYAVIFDKGDEVLGGLRELAKREGLSASHFTAIGAFSDAMLGYFDRDRKDYRRIPVPEQVEVLTLTGDVTSKDDEPTVHAHVVLGRSDGSAVGGHLLEAHVWPTLEVVLTESPAHLVRQTDRETGLALIR